MAYKINNSKHDKKIKYGWGSRPPVSVAVALQTIDSTHTLLVRGAFILLGLSTQISNGVCVWVYRACGHKSEH